MQYRDVCFKRVRATGKILDLDCLMLKQMPSWTHNYSLMNMSALVLGVIAQRTRNLCIIDGDCFNSDQFGGERDDSEGLFCACKVRASSPCMCSEQY